VTPKAACSHPENIPPITPYLRRHPWQLPNLLSSDVPKEFVVE
jgi:hypothetical protein